VALTVRAEAVVDLDAIRTSVSALAERASDAALLAVVKADGYGHGAVPAAAAALAGGATWLGVALVEEAAALRAAGIGDVPILVLVEPPPGAAEIAVADNVDLGIGSLAGLESATEAGRRAGPPVRVHLKADTGLTRGGSAYDDWPELVRLAAKAQAEGVVEIVGVWSHLACADEPGHPSIDAQLTRFHEALDVAAAAGVHAQVRHLANSAALLTRPDTHFDLVRPGIACYGLTPVPQIGDDFGLQPAMSLRSRVAMTKRVPAGTGISYGHRYMTARETTTALVPLGYADGVPRAATNTAEVWVAGGRHRISGTVCMDQFVIDVGDAEVSAGDEVVLFGPGAQGEPTAQDWADWLGTISYEIVTRVGQRVPRAYVGGPA
jgi:alanine racemase